MVIDAHACETSQLLGLLSEFLEELSDFQLAHRPGNLVVALEADSLRNLGRGLGGDHDQSYRYFMNTNLFDHVNIDKSKTYVPDGLEQDAVKACTDYDKILESLGHLDIQLLGIGGDGHIGFNEPADAFCVNTQCIDLENQTIQDNARLFFNGDLDAVPTQAYTMGIGYIMKSTTVILMATGAGKKDIVEKAFCGPVTPRVPASILQLHPNVVVIGDEAAISDAVVAAAK